MLHAFLPLHVRTGMAGPEEAAEGGADAAAGGVVSCLSSFLGTPASIMWHKTQTVSIYSWVFNNWIYIWINVSKYESTWIKFAEMQM